MATRNRNKRPALKTSDVAIVETPTIEEIEMTQAPVIEETVDDGIGYGIHADGQPITDPDPETNQNVEPPVEVPAEVVVAPVVSIKTYPTAIKEIAAVRLRCPKKGCGETVYHEDSSFLPIEVAGPGFIITCGTCKTEFKTPKSAFVY